MIYDITLHITGDPLREGRISAFREAAEFFDHEAGDFPVGCPSHIAYRRVSCTLFEWMEKEASE